MNLELSEDQFMTLMELVYLGGWMANANRAPEEEISRFEEMEDQIYAIAGEAGMTRDVCLDEHIHGYLPSQEFEKRLDAYIAEYDEATFKEELAYRLAHRDLLEAYGSAAETLPDPLLERYRAEISAHGVDRLRLAGT